MAKNKGGFSRKRQTKGASGFVKKLDKKSKVVLSVLDILNAEKEKKNKKVQEKISIEVQLTRQLSELDKRVDDMLHIIENIKKPTVVQAYHIFMELVRLRVKRRKLKNKLQLELSENKKGTLRIQANPRYHIKNDKTRDFIKSLKLENKLEIFV